MPLISLPESLLLQSTAGEQQRSEAADTRSGYSSGLWSVVQEGAGEVVEKAREAFFAEGQAQQFPITTTMKPTTTMTTVDVETLAKRLEITKDAATARNMLVSMIDRAQLGLIERLKNIDLDLDAMTLRAQEDLKAVDHSYKIAENMPIMASNAAVDVEKIQTNGKVLQEDTIPDLNMQAQNQKKLVAELMMTEESLKQSVEKGKPLGGAKPRVQDNTAVMESLAPRLERLEKRVTKIESRLYDGDLKKLVDDTSNKEVMNIMEDVQRGFGRFVKNP